ncbi:hypothetical protein [Marinobacter sp. 2_MG-2023]|uniref:hypothetical protein n=1 Tax=Marinobacter sp. 2_MG-2023 TaxID=3062679 RepID=UPI0026E3B7FF|nr:hypothetical protein [Marinobacter sp. 2_MG-2023]MDO6443709.1 hypothetical protein [Marinobacter sp. 2_MG-2023]
MISWYTNIRDILRSEPEVWLSYLYGQQLHNRPHFVRVKPRYAGFFLQVAKFFAILIRDFRPIKQPRVRQSAKFFVFAGSVNQLRSLDKTIEALGKKEGEVVVVGNPRILLTEDHDKGYIPVQLTLIDIFRIIVLFSIRGWGLYRVLKEKHPISISWHFSTFCSAYIYLVYFYRVLSQTKPEFVISANDHNVPNRCMLAVAHHIGIKTVYLQHASVSDIFPALRVHYAFLDGQCALDTYRECEPNQPATSRKAPVPEVILSGQKKYLNRVDSHGANVIGIALNALDDSAAAIKFIETLTLKGITVRLRWHPGQALKDTHAYRCAFSDNEWVELSDPKHEPISVFLGKLSWLVAGNSSIHLEAALAGVIPIYYELTPPDRPDYYGYVEHGLVHPAGSVQSIFELINSKLGRHSPDKEAVRYYSSTYLTEWDGREGELVAESLACLSLGQELPVRSVTFLEGSGR